MMALAAMWRQLIRLFVDDGALALAIAAIVVLAGVFAAMLPRVPAAAGTTLLSGCLIALFVNVMRAGKR